MTTTGREAPPSGSRATPAEVGGARLRLAELVAALSLATDLGTGRPIESGLRTSLLAITLGESLGLDEAALADLYFLVLLRYAGCTADAHLAAAIVGDEIAFQAELQGLDPTHPVVFLRAILGRAGLGEPPAARLMTMARTLRFMLRDAVDMAAAHCEVAQNLAGRLGVAASVRQALGQVFERWDGRGRPARRKGEQIALPVRIAHLAGEAEVFYRIGGIEAAVAIARDRAGHAFDPELVERFCGTAPRLLAALDVTSPWEAVLDAEPGERPRLSAEQLEVGTRVIADFVDLKSPYTAGHSSGVAALAATAAELHGLPDSDVVAIRQAGHLHDLGRVGVSAAIWTKPGPLSDDEWERVRLHPYHTERILARSASLARLGRIGALHHERLDGSGYHRGLPAALLPFEARLLAAADAYHAMTEPRPHRAALGPDAAAAELQQDVRVGRLDGDAVSAVLTAAGHRGRAIHRQRPAGLSDREVEILRLLARGLSNREMAGRLGISKVTVGHHVQHIYDKIGVSTRAAATLFAMQHDLLREVDESLPPH
jgi:HD-GYP domain-containing protein (c-di-GMP phosphodiesterase class II)